MILVLKVTEVNLVSGTERGYLSNESHRNQREHWHTGI